MDMDTVMAVLSSQKTQSLPGMDGEDTDGDMDGVMDHSLSEEKEEVLFGVKEREGTSNSLSRQNNMLLMFKCDLIHVQSLNYHLNL